MSIFGSKNMGLSDSLIDAVKNVKGRQVPTNIDIHRGLAEKMSSKEKMKKGLYNAKMDAVGKEDDDVDNDGDSDSSDEYLKKRRKAISKSVKDGKKEKDMGQDQVDVNPQMDDMKEAAGSRSIDKTDGETKLIKPSETHLCATKVEHAEWGEGECIFSEHAEPDESGHVEWYDVLFDHGIEHKVPVSEMKVKAEMSHGNHKKKK